LAEAEMVQPLSSPWVSPLVPDSKKDGKIRCRLDYRKLNEITTQDVYPFPGMDDSRDLRRIIPRLICQQDIGRYHLPRNPGERLLSSHVKVCIDTSQQNTQRPVLPRYRTKHNL